MHGGDKGAVRSDKYVVPEYHRADIQNHQVEICIAALAEFGIAAVVELERPLQKSAFAAVGEQFRHDCLAFFCIRFQGVVVFLGQPVRQLPPFFQPGIAGVVKLSGEHLLFFGHRGYLLFILRRNVNCIQFRAF